MSFIKTYQDKCFLYQLNRQNAHKSSVDTFSIKLLRSTFLKNSSSLFKEGLVSLKEIQSFKRYIQVNVP